ncbi:TIGR03857 family LLM class F420-dependent oxidoreductase [Nocardia sp. NPDC059177]|uniref:TIGR03857 family LLM class F420-dependent oxidoreductase n=1 Tax=Nocardia sp. NPDC059177 TaxID=3346759 RepID=UPI00367FA7CC
MATDDRQLDELGYYLLAGSGGDGPAGLAEQARAGERLGLGTAFLSERWNVKEAASLTGAACAVTHRSRIATAATNHNTRHPLITASWATTMHRLSGGRFTLGIGRGVAALHSAYGIAPVTTAQMADWADVMRRLWHGEVIIGHDGPLGSYPVLALDPGFDEDIPLAVVAFGPNTLALGGRVFDDVVLHTYFSPETLRRSVRTVKLAAERAGRDPGSVRVWSCLVTVGDHLPEELRLKKTVARLATYLQGYGDLLVRTNDWDPAVLQRFRGDPVVTSIAGPIDSVATPGQIEHIAELLPPEWLACAATGTPSRCAERVREEFTHGADRVILHGATPDELAPVVAAYRATDTTGASK